VFVHCLVLSLMLRHRNLFTAMTKFWLMKAEPNSRIVKGRDVKVGLC